MARRKVDGGLRSLFRERLTRAQWTPVETGVTALGVPDSEYCFPEGRQGWCEFKWTPEWQVRFQFGQTAWINRRWRLGGRAWVVVRRQAPAGPRRPACDELWLVPGSHVLVLDQLGLRAVEGVSSRWHGGPARWDWMVVEMELTR